MNENTSTTTPEKRPRAVLYILIVLVLAAIGYIVFISTRYEKVLQETQEQAKIELGQLQSQLDTMNVTNLDLQMQVESAMGRIDGLLDSMNTYQANENLLRSYYRQIQQLRKTNQQLFHVADSLNQLNQVLIAQNKQIESDLRGQAEVNRKLVDQNIKMSTDIENASKIDARNIRAVGIVVSNSGKITENERASRIDKIRVCFTLAKNNFVSKGDKTIYVRIVSPKKLIGVEKGNNLFAVGSEKLQWSGMTKVVYENQDLDVCIFVDGIRGDFVSGKYQVAIYADNAFIGETQMYLK